MDADTAIAIYEEDGVRLARRLVVATFEERQAGMMGLDLSADTGTILGEALGWVGIEDLDAQARMGILISHLAIIADQVAQAAAETSEQLTAVLRSAVPATIAALDGQPYTV